MIQLETAIDNSDREIFESILKEHFIQIVDKKVGETATLITLNLNKAEDIFWLGRIFQSRLNDQFDNHF